MAGRVAVPYPQISPEARYQNFIGACALVALLTAPWWIYQLFVETHGLEYFFDSGDVIVSAVTIPSVIAINLAVFFLLSGSERWVRPIIATGLALKVASTAAYLYFTMEVYKGSADLSHYLWIGKQLAVGYETMGKLPILTPFYNTNFVSMVTGTIMILLGQTVTAAMVIFATIGYWGQYFFYRAFCAAYPHGDRRLAAVLCLLTPSLLFWTSAVSKDALILPGIGLCCLGFARLNANAGAKGFLISAAGLGVVLIVRPHIAAMMGISVVVAYLLGRNLAGAKGVAAKAIAIPLLIIGTGYIVSQARVFVDLADFSGTRHTLDNVAESNRVGGSAFGSSSLPVRIAYAPFLLFRPFPWEARNLQSGLAAMEGMALLWIFWRRRSALLKVVRSARRDPFVLFILLYAVEMCVALAGGMTNFGLLVRQRVMMLAPVLLLLCVPPRPDAAGHERPVWVAHLYGR